MSYPQILRTIFSFFTLLSIFILTSCGKTNDSNNLDISGVWRAKGDGAMVVIKQSDNQIHLLINDRLIPITMGDIDKENKTINLYVKKLGGAQGVWTIQQIKNKEDDSLHLRLTLHTGVQDDLTFVRKLSSDDSTKISTLEANEGSTAIGQNTITSTDARTNGLQLQTGTTSSDVSATPALTTEQNKNLEKIIRKNAIVMTQSGGNAILRSEASKNAIELEKLYDQENIVVVGETSNCEVLNNHKGCWVKIVSSAGTSGYLFDAYLQYR